MGFPEKLGASGKKLACQCRRLRHVGSILGWEDLLEEALQPSRILPGDIPWTEEPGWLTVHAVAKSQEHDWSNITFACKYHLHWGHSLYFQCLRGTRISFKSPLMGKSKETFIFSPSDRGNNPVKQSPTQRFLWTVGGCEAMWRVN